MKQIHDTADKLVTSFWGQKNFDYYVYLDKENSRYFGSETQMVASFNKDINFITNSFRFNYNVVHSAFRGDTAHIEFTLDSTGKLEVGFHPQGLYQPGDLDTLKTITKAKAVTNARKTGLLKGKQKWKVTLEWMETDPTTLDLKPNCTLQQFVQGHYCWAVASTFDKPYRQGCFIYSTRVYYFDIITGQLIDKKDI